jgi:V/A-type H+-transporting ATPase subunit F
MAPPESVPGADNCQVLMMTEETADWLGDFMINWQLSGRYPLIVEIPGISGRIDGRKTLVDSIREAIGIHI